MKLTELKVKRKSLAEEARIIRREERALIKAGKGATSKRESLYLHRVLKVRSASRYAHLAHAWGTGRLYKQVEQSTHEHNEPSRELLMKELRAFDTLFAAQDKKDQSNLVKDWLEGEAPPSALLTS